ncbi:uncharacterized protein [Primulina huaijiensis]|uniref:uncharacterized protein n=1 Tax=Primulina huaijiensis TaxID=1492673 RepID=UPI003CC70E62
MAWLYETVPVLGVRRGLNVYPRLFSWGKSKIPLNAAGTETLLKHIDSTQVLSIHPFCEEEKLLVDMNLVLNQETNRSEVKRFEKLVLKQMNDLKILRKRCAELEGEKVRRRMKGKRSVEDKRDNVVESEEKVDKTEEKMTFESPHDARANFGDFVDVVVNAVVSDLAKEKKELDESHSLNASVDESIGGSFVATCEVEKKTISQSSIADHVRARDDRVKKKKGSMFVTPPSSTPRRKRKMTKQEVIDVEKKGNTPGKVAMDEFQGRSDFCGHEEADDEERKLVTNFLARKELEYVDLPVVVWQDTVMSLSGPILCHFLFGDPVESEIINVYMRIMQKQSLHHGFEIYCMDTMVQKEVLTKLEQHGKRSMVHRDDYGAFLSLMTSFTMARLQELTGELFRRCRYIIFPMNDRWHWFLLVYKRDEGIFKLWNSMHDPFSVGKAKVYTKFLAGSIRHLCGFDLVSELVLREPCRQQDATLNCGVYACMWLECLARDTDEIWSYAQDVKMDTYRARLAATILSDENGLLKNKFE